MARVLLPEDLWREIAPLLPPPRPRPKGGRRPIEHRAALTGILFVLRSGLPWEMLPAEMGCGSGMTCWRRLRDWQAAGVWDRLHQVLLGRLHDAGQLDWSRASLDSASVPAKKGALPPARTRRIAASRGPSATSSSMPAARPSA
jgi:transposase